MSELPVRFYEGQYVAVFHLTTSRSIYDSIYAAICSSMFCNSLCILLVVLESLIIKIEFNLDSLAGYFE